MQKLVCQCGGVIEGKAPSHCPHCGAKVARVHRRAAYRPVVIVALLFTVLMLFFVWLLRQAA